jgi:hypothetical protein
MEDKIHITAGRRNQIVILNIPSDLLDADDIQIRVDIARQASDPITPVDELLANCPSQEASPAGDEYHFGSV